MKKVCFLTFALVWISLIQSCKKDEDVVPVQQQQNTSVTVDSQGNLIFPQTIHGAFYTNKGNNVYYNGSDTTKNYFYGYFAWGGSPTTFVDIDSVTATSNNVVHELSKNIINYYTLTGISSDTSILMHTKNPILWHVKGNSSLPGFDYADSSDYPTYNYTISGAHPTTNSISVNVQSNSDIQVVYLNLQNTSGDAITIKKAVSGNNHNFVFNSSEWAATVPGTLNFISVYYNTYELGDLKTINSKNLYFVKQISDYKNFIY